MNRRRKEKQPTIRRPMRLSTMYLGTLLSAYRSSQGAHPRRCCSSFSKRWARNACLPALQPGPGLNCRRRPTSTQLRLLRSSFVKTTFTTSHHLPPSCNPVPSPCANLIIDLSFPDQTQDLIPPVARTHRPPCRPSRSSMTS